MPLAVGRSGQPILDRTEVGMTEIKLRPDVGEGTHWLVWALVLIALLAGIFWVVLR